jgi:arylsulfatase A-like enzyme
MTSLVTDTTAVDETTYSAYLYRDKVQALIENHAVNKKDTPMFLYYASQLVHNPVEAPQKYIDICQDATATLDESTYCALNLVLDEMVGDLTCTLKSNGMYDNTLFILASDNGGANPEKGSSYPWKGGKGSMFRGGSSANAFIYGSSNIIPEERRGTKYEGLMHVTDWLPTLMGVATNNEWTGSYVGNTVDGVNQFASMLSNLDSNRHEILHFMTSQANISYQYDTYKGILQTSKTAGYLKPSHYFKGNSSATIGECLVDSQ